MQVHEIASCVRLSSIDLTVLIREPKFMKSGLRTVRERMVVMLVMPFMLCVRLRLMRIGFFYQTVWCGGVPLVCWSLSCGVVLLGKISNLSFYLYAQCGRFISMHAFIFCVGRGVLILLVRHVAAPLRCAAITAQATICHGQEPFEGVSMGADKDGPVWSWPSNQK